jgi:type IV pilus assembly protein PilY1
MRHVISICSALLFATATNAATAGERLQCIAPDTTSMTIWNDRDSRVLYSVSANDEGGWTASALRLAQREAQQQLWTNSTPAHRDATTDARFVDIPTAPVLIAPPAYRFADTLETNPYSVFVREQAKRPTVLYFGAAEGLVALDARTGRLVASFKPSHSEYVGGTPAVSDAFVDGRWRTVLVGGLNGGGQAIYALDVTDPRTAPGGRLLWQFSDGDDADLGFTYSRPLIARAHTGAWVAIFGNGYDSQHADDHASPTGAAALFVVDLASGRLIRKLPTPAADSGALNGLSSPAAVDVDRDSVVDFVYAGDLQGHLWKFDLRSGNSDEWQVAQHGQPLFKARDARGNAQPIVQRPEVARGPQGLGTIVVFGAGAPLHHLAATRGRPHTHSLYGIYDLDRGPVARAQLAQPRRSGNPSSPRQASANTPAGWFVDFAARSPRSHAEELAGEVTVRDGHVIVSTLRTPLDGCEHESNDLTLHSFRVSDGESFPAQLGLSKQTRSANKELPRTNASAATSTRARVIRNAPVVVSVATTAAECFHDIYAPGVDGVERLTFVCERTALGRRSWMQTR